MVNTHPSPSQALFPILLPQGKAKYARKARALLPLRVQYS